MNVGVRDFFIGVVHLFVIFLPGAFLLLSLIFFAQDESWPRDDPLANMGIGPAGKTVLFLGTSYFLGHLLSILASKIEDNLPLRIRFLERSDKVDVLRTRAYAICVDRFGFDLVRRQTLRRWATVLLKHGGNDLRSDLDAKDADRRFFRNIVLAFPIAGVLVGWKTYAIDGELPLVEAGGLMLLLGLTGFRYLDQDAKFTALVFESLIAEHPDAPQRCKWRGKSVTHAGGVVYRKIDGAVRYCLVTATGTADERVLPKGHIGTYETADQAAEREVIEEAGIEAEARFFLGVYAFKQSGRKVRVANFLLAYKQEVSSEAGRAPEWFSYEEAQRKLPFADARSILQRAAELVDPVSEQAYRNEAKVTAPDIPCSGQG